MWGGKERLQLLAHWTFGRGVSRAASHGAGTNGGRHHRRRARHDGAVLPGVTVEAASPALIEKVRTAITDGQGRYTITDLRSGTYSVTVTLTGFNAYKREGIELSAGFTATVNANLKVGSVQETVTVSGAAPIVDTQNSRTQQVLKTETLNALPGSRSPVSV